ncbi:MAG TPA: dienelactone hydrolase family protein [Chitinophagaceae bacterium]|nr:dienelactone hydrolase family protein [Chitinophagaceae bacterium]
MKQRKAFLFIITTALLAACNNQPSTPSTTADSTVKETARSPNLKEENVTYTGDSTTMNGYVVYDSNKEGKRPAVLVIHEWWGLNDYPKMRARKLAELGYIAMALDLYGNGKTADNPTDAGKLSGLIYGNTQMAKARFDAALNKLKTYSQVDTNNIAAIGYCFGGAIVLNMARLGENLKGVVSFHGNLIGTPANKNLLRAKILVCHGADDPWVKPEEVAQFKKQMDSIGADYSVKDYPHAVHAFTNPNATAVGEKFNIPIRYNGAADTASWNDMKDFFDRVLK